MRAERRFELLRAADTNYEVCRNPVHRQQQDKCQALLEAARAKRPHRADTDDRTPESNDQCPFVRSSDSSRIRFGRRPPYCRSGRDQQPGAAYHEGSGGSQQSHNPLCRHRQAMLILIMLPKSVLEFPPACVSFATVPYSISFGVSYGRRSGPRAEAPRSQSTD
jgi:hypothetical protein